MFFVLFANPLFSINGTNVKSFTQPYLKSEILSKAENFFVAPERNFRKTGWTLKKFIIVFRRRFSVLNLEEMLCLILT